jgi:hypothetical protein
MRRADIVGMVNALDPQLTSKLKLWLAEFSEAGGLEPTLLNLDEESWDPDDIDGFERAIELFPSRGKGKFRWPRGHSEIALFWHGPKSQVPRSPHFAREAIAVMAAVADLHQELGWPRELIEVETKNYVFDFAAYQVSAGGECMAIGGEAKSSGAEIECWLDALIYCSHLGEHASTVHEVAPRKQIRRNAHKKWVELVAEAPDYLWLVAPGSRRAFALSHRGHKISLTESGALPRAYDPRL